MHVKRGAVMVSLSSPVMPTSTVRDKTTPVIPQRPSDLPGVPRPFAKTPLPPAERSHRVRPSPRKALPSCASRKTQRSPAVASRPGFADAGMVGYSADDLRAPPPLLAHERSEASDRAPNPRDTTFRDPPFRELFEDAAIDSADECVDEADIVLFDQLKAFVQQPPASANAECCSDYSESRPTSSGGRFAAAAAAAAEARAAVAARPKDPVLSGSSRAHWCSSVFRSDHDRQRPTSAASAAS